MSLEQYSSQDPRITSLVESGPYATKEFKATLATKVLTDLFALSYAETVKEGPFSGRVAYERGTLSGTFAVKTGISEGDAADCAYQLINHVVSEGTMRFEEVYKTLIDFSLSTGPGCYTHQTAGPLKGDVPEALERRVSNFANLFPGDMSSVSIGSPLISRYKKDLALQKNVKTIVAGSKSKDDVVVGGPIYPSEDGSYDLGEDEDTEEISRPATPRTDTPLERRL